VIPRERLRQRKPAEALGFQTLIVWVREQQAHHPVEDVRTPAKRRVIKDAKLHGVLLK
jgi:hypothetical protein